MKDYLLTALLCGAAIFGIIPARAEGTAERPIDTVVIPDPKDPGATVQPGMKETAGLSAPKTDPDDLDAKLSFRERVFRRFDMHDRNYYLFPSHRDGGPGVEHDIYNNFKRNDVGKLQISIRYQVTRFAAPVDAYVAYTQKSFQGLWDKSAPFREHNFKPEAFVEFRFNDSRDDVRNWMFREHTGLGDTFLVRNLRKIRVGFIHESNGMGIDYVTNPSGPSLPRDDSRSWNRAMAQLRFVFCPDFMESKDGAEITGAKGGQCESGNYHIKLNVTVWVPTGKQFTGSQARLTGTGAGAAYLPNGGKFTDSYGYGELMLSISPPEDIEYETRWGVAELDIRGRVGMKPRGQVEALLKYRPPWLHWLATEAQCKSGGSCAVSKTSDAVGKIWFAPDLALQVFHGYGEGLISFNKRETAFRAGLALRDN